MCEVCGNITQTEGIEIKQYVCMKTVWIAL